MILVDFFEYSATIAERLARQHTAKLGKIVTPDSQAMIGEIKRFLSLYETYQSTEYNIYDSSSSIQASLFIVSLLNTLN